MKDIKALYLAAKGGRKSDIDHYTEAVNEIINSPNDYLANSEYIINSEIGLATLNEFVDRFGLAIPVCNRFMEQVDKCIDKCNSISKNPANYIEAKKFLESYKNKYQNCFDMYEYYSCPDDSKYIKTYYSFNENGVRNSLLPDMINVFGEYAVPDMIITASQISESATSVVYKMMEAHDRFGNPMMYQWMSECAMDPGLAGITSQYIENVKTKNLDTIINSMRDRNTQLYRESMLLGNENAMYDYTAEEVEAIEDMIEFKEYRMACCESADDAINLQKEIYSLYEEYDGMRVNDQYVESATSAKIKTVKNIIKNTSEIFKETKAKAIKFLKDEIMNANNGRSLNQRLSVPAVLISLGTPDEAFDSAFKLDKRTQYISDIITDPNTKNALFIHVLFEYPSIQKNAVNSEKCVKDIIDATCNTIYDDFESYGIYKKSKDDNIHLEKYPLGWKLKIPVAKEYLSMNINRKMFESVEGPDELINDPNEIHDMMCESLSDMILYDAFTESSDKKFKYAYKAAYDYDTGHSLKITYSLDKVIVTDVGVAKPLHDELLDAVNSVKEIMNDDNKFKIPRALAASLNRLFHMKGNIEIRKNSITQFLQEYINEIGYVDFQAKNVKIVSIYDRADKVELQGPINTVGIYAANDINTNRSLALSDYELKQMQDKVRSKKSNFIINSISVGDIQKTPTFMSTYWDPNSDKNLVNGNGDVISNDGMDRDNITNIVSAKEIHGYGSGIEKKKYSDALGDFVDPIHDITHAKVHKMYKTFNSERAQRSLDKESKLIRNMQELYKAMSDRYNNETDDAVKASLSDAMHELGDNIKSEKGLYNASKRLFDNDDYEGVYNTLKSTYAGESISKFKDLLDNYSNEFNLKTNYVEDVATSVISMLPQASINEDTWMMNTHDKKTSNIPGYISNNHDIAKYGEDDGDSKRPKKEGQDEEPKKDLEYYRRKSAKPQSDTNEDGEEDIEDILSPVDNNEKGSTSKDDNDEKSPSSNGVNNYYYYTYNNSLNRDHSVHNSDDHSVHNQDDHSTNKHIETQNNNASDKSHNESGAEPWKLDIFNNDFITEEVGDADDNKPESDHPVKDVLMDIDQKTTKYRQGAKKAVENIQNAGRAFVKPIKRTEMWINNMVANWKDADETKVKEKLADPRARKNIFYAIKQAIIGGSLLKAGILLNPIFLFIAITKKIGNKKNEGRIRNEMIAELKMEIEICDDKIQDAERAGDNKAKYQLKRFKNELMKKMSRAAGVKNW